MKQGWTKLAFTEVLSDETGGNLKTLQSDYLSEGIYPIIDQGKELIAGYTNDVERLCKVKTPVIVFGDHTKCFKYVEFPFCLGADGTKILKPKIPCDEKYLFYLLQTVHIPDAGYSRHFKYLKSSELLLPPLEEQKRIAAILDQADALRRLRQRSINQLNSLGQAIFYEMFGDPVRNPMGWPKQELGIYLKDVTNGLTRRHKDSEPAKQVVLRLKDIRSGWIDYSDTSRITLSPKEVLKYYIFEGDLLFVRVNGNPEYVGRCSVYEGHNEDVYFNDHIMRVRIDTTCLDSSFLCFLLNLPYGKQQIASHRKTSAGQHTINQEGLSKIKIPVPPIDLQLKLKSNLHLIQVQNSKFFEDRENIDKLFFSLQQRAFNGELLGSANEALQSLREVVV